jgi:hypothetical protein
MSSMKTTTNLSNSGMNTEFIRYMKCAGALVSPNDITKYSYKTISKLEMRDLDHPVICRCRKHQQLVRWEGGFAACFPPNVLMVHSSTLAIATDGERLTSGNFSLSETVPFGSLDFITDCFGDLSLSPKGGGATQVLSLWERPATGVTQVLSLWEPPTSSTRLLVEREALASPSLEGSARGHRLLPPQSHDG